MGEWACGLGCTPAEQKRSLPLSLPASVSVIEEIRQEFDAPSPSIQAERSATRTSMGPPPPPPPPGARLGLDLERQPTSQEQRLFPLSPLTRYSAGGAGSGLGCGVAEPNTQTHRQQDKGKKTFSADPRLDAQTQTVLPSRVGQCL